MPLSGIFGIGGTGFVGAYNASQYTPSQLAEYVQEQVQEQAYNKTVAMCPKAGRLQNVMPNFGPLPYKLTSEGAGEHHIGIYWNGKDGSSTGSMFLGDKALGNQYYNSSTDNPLKARMSHQGFYTMFAKRIGVCGPGESFPDGCTWNNPSNMVAEASSARSSASTSVPPSSVRHEDAVAAAAALSSSTRDADSITVVILDTGTPDIQLPKDTLDRAALLFYGNLIRSASDDVTIYLELKNVDSTDVVMLKIDAAMLFSRTKYASVYPSAGITDTNYEFPPADLTYYDRNCIFETYGYCSVASPTIFLPTVLPDKTIVQMVFFGRAFWNGFYTVFSYEDDNANGTVTLMAKPYEPLGPPLSPDYYFRHSVQIAVVVLTLVFIVGFVIAGIGFCIVWCTKKIRMGKKSGLDEALQ